MRIGLTTLAAGCSAALLALTLRAAGDSPTPHADGLRYRGVAVQMQTGFGPYDTYMPLIREIAELGADTVLLSTPALMEHARGQAIFIDVRKTPAPDEFKRIIRDSKALGLKVVIMPIILLSHPRGSEWRGVIEPPNWDDWFRQYREFIAHFADVAREGGADVLMVGSELVSTEKYTAQWVRVIELARQHFPGQLGYSANWDHYKPIQFWDKLDLVGMTSYYKLADRQNPDIDEIVAKWKPVHDEITAWQRKIGKPLVLTEVGWCSQSGAATAPWNYYQNMKATPEGHEEQRRLYEGFARVWDGTPGLAGVIWWEWTASPGGIADFGYTPKAKPAERVLRDWFAAGRGATASGTASDSSPRSP
ncbi:MAG: hypothetical protein CHACPFDD_00962 [Phycisphaerae bacterium]|nr:hypothetical protein [Phycisphaerae bacterium]